jgi:Skp family chaperone for outer membrane proteins
MTRFAAATVLSLALGALPTVALAQAKPATPPATQKPAVPAPAAQQPAAPPAQQTPPPPKPFIEGAKIAYMNIQRVASESAEGRAMTSRVKALQDQKVGQLATKNKELETAQGKVNQTVLSDDARAKAQKDVDRLTVEIQRMQQDAEAELNELQQQLQLEFQRKVSPIIQQVAQEKGIQILLSQADAGIIWADGGVDLTAEIIKRFDASGGAKPPAGTQK